MVGLGDRLGASPARISSDRSTRSRPPRRPPTSTPPPRRRSSRATKRPSSWRSRPACSPRPTSPPACRWRQAPSSPSLALPAAERAPLMPARASPRDGRPAGIRRDREPQARRARLLREDLVAAEERTGMRRGRLGCLLGPAGLDHEDRLCERDLAGGGEEAACVADRLHVQGDALGVRVVAEAGDDLAHPTSRMGPSEPTTTVRARRGRWSSCTDHSVGMSMIVASTTDLRRTLLYGAARSGSRKRTNSALRAAESLAGSFPSAACASSAA